MSPRPKRLRKINNPPCVRGFKPYGHPSNNDNAELVFLHYEEYEALRLCDYEMMNHLEASLVMGVSRPTLTRIYAVARKKVAEAFVKGRQIVFEGGKVYFDTDWYKCSNCNCSFNNQLKNITPKECPLCKSKSITEYAEL